MAKNSDFEITSSSRDKVLKKLHSLATDVPRELEKAVYSEGNIEKNESMRRTPVLTGEARASHELEKPKWNGTSVSVRLVAGGPSLEYVIPLHENTEAFHKNGQAKFMESTIRESARFFPFRVAKRVRDGWKG